MYPFECVDEYQDTNGVQDLLLRALYPDRRANLFVVADDDQTIYQWNGASPERLRRLQHDYDMRVVQLPESFRCPPEVVGLANNLIRHNVDRAPTPSSWSSGRSAPTSRPASFLAAWREARRRRNVQEARRDDREHTRIWERIVRGRLRCVNKVFAICTQTQGKTET